MDYKPPNPRISVVIPVYCHTHDHVRFLDEALHSVAEQTWRDFETIIVDDRSPIDIAPTLGRIGSLPALTVLRTTSNLGHAEARNAGVRAATGELIAFLDHDDAWMPQKLARQVEVIEANADAAMVFCDMETFGLHADRLRLDQSIIPERPDFYWFVSHGNYTISASAVMVRRRALLDIGLFDSRYSTCDDFDAWLKIVARSTVIHMPETLARYRLHTWNVNYGVDRLNDNRLLTALIWRYWRTAPLVERIRLLPRMARKLIGRLYFTFFRHRTFADGGERRVESGEQPD